MTHIETVKIKTTPSTVELEKRIAESRNETLEDHLKYLLIRDAERTLGYTFSEKKEHNPKPKKKKQESPSK